MKTELSPLEAWNVIGKYQVCTNYENDEYNAIKDILPNCFKKVETALKENEQARVHELKVRDFDKKLKVLKILKAFGFEIEDYTEDEHGSIKVKCDRIILDDEEIDIAKEVLL